MTKLPKKKPKIPTKPRGFRLPEYQLDELEAAGIDVSAVVKDAIKKAHKKLSAR